MKIGDLVERDAAGGGLIYGQVVWAGRATYVVLWEDHVRIRIAQGYAGVRPALDRGSAAVAISRPVPHMAAHERVDVVMRIVNALHPSELDRPLERAKLHAVRKMLDRLLEQAERMHHSHDRHAIVPSH